MTASSRAFFWLPYSIKLANTSRRSSRSVWKLLDIETTFESQYIYYYSIPSQPLWNPTSYAFLEPFNHNFNFKMSTLEDLDDLEREQKEEKKDDGDKDKKPTQTNDADAEMKDAESEKEEDPIDEEIYSLGTQDILTRKRLLENDSRIMKSEFQRLSHEKAAMGEKIKDNLEKIENNR